MKRTRDYLLPITERERELLAGVGIADLDLARRVNLVPVKDGWVTLRLTELELKSLIWVAAPRSPTRSAGRRGRWWHWTRCISRSRRPIGIS